MNVEPKKLAGLWGARQAGSLWDISGVAPTIKTPSGGYSEPLILLDKNEKESVIINETKTQTHEPVATKPFNYVSLFSGIGGFETALNGLGGHCVMASEIDKYANQAYEVLYGEPTVGDVTKVDAADVPDHDVLVGGFPCQAFSVAGKRKGFEDTRGTLFFEVARIARVKQPRLVLLENVKGLVSHDRGKTLDTIVQTLCDIGYTVDFNVLNSKYFGVPQNRERIFIIGVLDGAHAEWHAINDNTRKDVVAKGRRRIAQLDGVRTFNFDWPEQGEVTSRLRDILEDDVDERYYLSEEKTAKLVAQLDEKEKVAGSVGHHPFSKKAEFSGYNGDVSPCLIATDYKAPKTLLEEIPHYRIRKLTPLECWRLQGFTDEQHDAVANAGISNSQRYKMAGNAVTVNVIQAIGARLLRLL